MDTPKIIHIVLDVLKPHQPPLPEFAMFIGELDGVERVNTTVVEMDERTQSLRIIIDGNIDYEGLRDHMALQGAVIHSVDRVIVEESKKSQNE
jgi:hypothetical protein